MRVAYNAHWGNELSLFPLPGVARDNPAVSEDWPGRTLPPGPISEHPDWGVSWTSADFDAWMPA